MGKGDVQNPQTDEHANNKSANQDGSNREQDSHESSRSKNEGNYSPDAGE